MITWLKMVEIPEKFLVWANNFGAEKISKNAQPESHFQSTKYNPKTMLPSYSTIKLSASKVGKSHASKNKNLFQAKQTTIRHSRYHSKP